MLGRYSWARLPRKPFRNFHIVVPHACPRASAAVPRQPIQTTKQSNMKTNRIISLTAALVAALISTTAFAHEGEDHAKGGASGLPKTYPLKTCVVSDDKLGAHGKVVKVSHDGTDVYLCCKDCVKDFNKDPDKFTKMVKKAGPKK